MKQVLRDLRRLSDGVGASDGELLGQFIAHKDELAFAALVRRHGAMVLGVCRRVTGHPHDAEDAFQAAFLVLARKAVAVKPRELLANWLYGVAWRSALEARTKAARRQSREQPFDDMPDPNPRSTDHREACEVLDQELGKLADKYRSAIVLCELEGRPRQEVAECLGIPPGTLSSRLAHARKLLAKRLARRGVVLSAAGFSVLASANVASASLVAATVTTCMKLAAGRSLIAAEASAGVLKTTEGVMKAMLLEKLKKSALLAFAVLCLAGLVAWGVVAADSQDVPARPNGAKKDQRSSKPQPRPQLAGEGRIMIFRDGALASMKPDGKDVRWLLSKDDKVLLHPFSNASLSPDGKRLALLVIDREAIEAAKGLQGDQKATAHVYVRDANDKGPGEKLGVTGIMCIWSGDSAKLLVTEMDQMPGKFAAMSWIVDIKTKEKTALDLPKNHLVTDWSRDGQWLLASVVEPEKSRLVMMKKDGSSRYDVTAPGLFAVGKLSPDGKKVLYVGKELMVQNLSKDRAGEPLRLSALNHVVLGFTWSPDGQRVAYTCRLSPDATKDRQELEESFLVIVDADGTNLVTAQTEKGTSPNVPLGSVEWR